MVSSAMGTPTTITVHDVERLNPKTVRVTLNPGEHASLWPNVPGGYLTFCLPCAEPALTRSYSLVQGPDDALPQVIVKETGASRGSAFVNREFEAGMSLMAYPPQGRLFPTSWNDEPSHFVMFAGGTGITPLYSVMQHVLHGEVPHEVTLFYNNHSFKDILLREELDEWASHPKVSVTHILNDGSMDEDLHNGQLTSSKTMLLLDAMGDSALPTKFLVSGPAKMKENVLRGLDLAGHPPHAIRYEDFHHPPHLDAPSIPQCEVVAAFGGKEVNFIYRPHEETLMDAITNHGLNAPQSCRGGVCGSCRAEIHEGEVAVDQDFALTRAERVKGWVLCCQAKPLSEKVSLSFKADQ